ncbi:hypothetical protein D9C73_008998 [Collichthys lucidus]|uniref:Uncharacterized protein n=1 Tax=Collichthys lucidus TaxID=240159 RepID=A0A4U5UN11_COLLU|nr:hypothetical protein D9C73_008998 [Collichthys lucidus]
MLQPRHVLSPEVTHFVRELTAPPAAGAFKQQVTERDTWTVYNNFYPGRTKSFLTLRDSNKLISFMKGRFKFVVENCYICKKRIWKRQTVCFMNVSVLNICGPFPADVLRTANTQNNVAAKR